MNWPTFLLSFGATLASIYISYQVGKLHTKNDVMEWLSGRLRSGESEDVVDFIDALIEEQLAP